MPLKSFLLPDLIFSIDEHPGQCAFIVPELRTKELFVSVSCVVTIACFVASVELDCVDASVPFEVDCCVLLADVVVSVLVVVVDVVVVESDFDDTVVFCFLLLSFEHPKNITEQKTAKRTPMNNSDITDALLFDAFLFLPF